MENTAQTMSVKHAARYLGVGVSKMYQIAHSDDFTAALRIGKRILISKEALDEWLRENTGSLNS